MVDRWQELHSERRTASLNLWARELPDLAGPALAARAEVEAGRSPSGDAAVAWSRLQELASGLVSAERLLISTPMWNFGLPYRLKHYIDCVTQPTLTYEGSPRTGFQGLLAGKPAALVLARGGSYPDGSERGALDFQSRYLEAWLRFLGFGPVTTIRVEPTTLDPEAVLRGEAQVLELADRF